MKRYLQVTRLSYNLYVVVIVDSWNPEEQRPIRIEIPTREIKDFLYIWDWNLV